MKHCYIMSHDCEHSGDPEVDAFALPFDDMEMTGAHFMGIEDIKLPKKIYCSANFELIPQYDYPLTDLGIPIMSLKMLSILTQTKGFKHSGTPVVMLDDQYLDDQLDENGNPKPEVKFDDNYVAVQIREYTEAFDYEKSKYDQDLIFPEDIGIIYSLILKEPSTGFPPLFRTKENIGYLFVSQEAKDALEKAGIVGCVFKPVEVSE